MIKTIKTKQFKIIAAVLALVLTVSCITWNATKVHAQELNITGTNVQGFSLLGNSRAISNGTLVGTEDEAATMGVFITGGSKEKYNATNEKWEHNGINWTSEVTMLYEGTGSNQQIYAISPYPGRGITESITVDIAEQTDWLVAKATELTGSNVNLTMTHALAKLVLVPTFGSEVTLPNIIKVEVSGMYATGTLNIAENSWSNLSDANATLTTLNRELLVIPMASCTEFTITVIADGNRTFTTTVSLAGVGNKLEAGTQYNIELQIGQDKVTLGGITANSWNETVGGNLETE